MADIMLVTYLVSFGWSVPRQFGVGSGKYWRFIGVLMPGFVLCECWGIGWICCQSLACLSTLPPPGYSGHGHEFESWLICWSVCASVAATSNMAVEKKVPLRGDREELFLAETFQRAMWEPTLLVLWIHLCQVPTRNLPLLSPTKVNQRKKKDTHRDLNPTILMIALLWIQPAKVNWE